MITLHEEMSRNKHLDNILFLDTESDENTKEIISIQLYWNGHIEIIKNTKHLERIVALWEQSEAVVIWNAPYDMGVLSSLPGNSHEWKGEKKESKEEEKKWFMELFGYKYQVKKLASHYNHIACGNKNTPPVIDLLKLWNILIETKDLKFKHVSNRHLGVETINYSAENAKTRDYQVQDVVYLCSLWYKFLEKVSTIPLVSDYTYADWGKICTPASFVKNAYLKEYPTLKEWKETNKTENEKWGLTYALEQAYNGGITCALYHGTIVNTAWFDIHGAYAHVIEYENTDIYKKYHWEQVEPDQELDRDRNPLLCKVKTNTFICSINDSLKIFQVKNREEWWMWSYDILALRNLFDDADIVILEAYKPVPENPVVTSLPAQWSALKEEEERLHGKTTLREYYKFMSNTSYGITAQRNPHSTIHTNMCIAGIITSRAHLILCEMINEARKMGCEWMYSDTDSICVRLNGAEPQELDKILNERITPYSCGCEFIGSTRILSLKRYIAVNGKELDGTKAKDKVKTHGKSVYNLSEDDISEMLSGKIDLSPLYISQVTATTPITFKRCEKLCSTITNPHPFMFTTNIPTGRNKQDFFRKWYKHIDAKLTVPEKGKVDDEFERNFHVFFNFRAADKHYTRLKGEDLMFEEDDFDLTFRDYDAEDKVLFGTDL